MTIASLLSKLGRRTPLFVTVAGQVIGAADVVKADGEFRHPNHGRVTSVAKHAFHDGDDPIPTEVVNAWWINDPSALEIERNNMALAFPGFTEVTTDGRPGWTGEIDTGRGKRWIELVHRRDHGLPSVEVLSARRLERRAGRRFVRSPHLFTSGKLCVAYADDWNADEHDAVTVVAWAAHWLAAYSEWRFTSKWPSEGAAVEAA